MPPGLAAPGALDLRPRPPRCHTEASLALPLAPRPIPAGPRPLGASARVRAWLLAAAPSGQHRCPLVVATDGGSSGSSWLFRWGAWGAAVAGSSSLAPHHIIGGPLPGADQTALACEAWAAMQILWAAAAENLPLVLLVDNATVVKRLSAIQGGSCRGTLPPTMPSVWEAAAVAIAQLPSFAVHWVPAQGDTRIGLRPLA